MASDLKPVGMVLVKLLILGFCGGFVAGAFGLGGGVVFNPLLLQLGMPPRVSSATGSYLITFSKISSCLIYALGGYFIWDYAGWVSLWSIFGAFVSQWFADWYMNKYGK